WRRLILYVLFLLLIFHIGGGWYFADQLRVDALVPDNEADTEDVTLREVGNGQVTLEAVEDREPDLTAAGLTGLDWGTGYGQVGEILSEDDDGSVTRGMTRIEGESPTAGMLGRLDGSAFPGDPQRAFGLTFSEIEYQSPVGAVRAWEILAPGDIWVIHVHGLGAPRTEALRLVRPVADAGYPQLVIGYRNDLDEPADPSGYYRYGQTEWEDVGAAVDLAVERGASQVVLVGYSTGASHILSYLYRTPDAPVAAAIFDAPNIDFEQTVDLGASQRNLPLIPLKVPGSLVWVAKRIASLRFSLDWSAIDYIARADQLQVPVLVFHGAEDATVPLASSQEFAAARPDLVRLVIVADAGHVRSWNVGPESYERRVTEFLSEVAGLD
ncbi:MAG TPA: alpha/beta fold hydrolase, partial [Acidimicrobiia bacterium]